MFQLWGNLDHLFLILGEKIMLYESKKTTIFLPAHYSILSLEHMVYKSIHPNDASHQTFAQTAALH